MLLEWYNLLRLGVHTNSVYQLLRGSPRPCYIRIASIRRRQIERRVPARFANRIPIHSPAVSFWRRFSRPPHPVLMLGISSLKVGQAATIIKLFGNSVARLIENYAGRLFLQVFLVCEPASATLIGHPFQEGSVSSPPNKNYQWIAMSFLFSILAQLFEILFLGRVCHCKSCYQQ